MHGVTQARHRKKVSKARQREIKKKRDMKEALRHIEHEDEARHVNPLEKIEEVPEIIDDGTIDGSGNVPEASGSRCVVM